MEVLKCENCGNEHDGSYGSGRFCSKKCRFSFIGKSVKNRKCNLPLIKDEKQIQELYEKNIAEQRWKCPHCGLCFGSSKLMQKHTRENHARYDENGKRISWSKGLTKENNSILKRTSEKMKDGFERGIYKAAFKGKTHSEETKKLLSIKKKQFLENNPDKHPYKRFTHKNGKSYAEDYFENWLKKENFQFESELGIGRYSCDFLVNGVYDLEIDGQFHKNDPKKVEIDKRKTEFLLSRGIKTVRVYWPDYSKYNEEERIIFLSDLKKILMNESEIESLTIRANEKRQERLKTCLHCGKKFDGSNSDFCSRECKDLYNRMPIPEDFKEFATTMKVMELARKYKTNHTQISRWYKRSGIERKKRKSPKMR